MTLRSAAHAGLVVAAGVLTALFRFLTMQGIANDHFLHLAGAQQMLFGDWPTRDFADPGLPMMYVASALAQAIGGHTLLSEAVLVSVAFGLAAGLTSVAVLQLTSSIALAGGAALLEVAIFPRAYGYPKVLLYAAAFILFQRYVSRATTGRLVAMAAFAAVAFLFRHDHGLYIAAGAALTTMLASAGTWGAAFKRTTLFAAVFAALLLPYLVYVEMFGGIVPYLRTGIAFSVREAERQGRVWPNPFETDQPAQAVILYLFHLLPAAAVVTLLVSRRAERSRILPLAAVAVLVNFSFMRDPLGTRLPDAVVPAVLLGAWLTACAWGATRHRAIWVAASLVVLCGAAPAVFAVGNTLERINSMGLTEHWGQWPERFKQRTVELREPFARRQIPTQVVTALIPFFAYLDRCTTTSDHLLVAGFMPEVPYYARRPFAGGQSTFVEGYYASTENQESAIARLRLQSAPFVLMPSTEAAGFDESFPLVAAYLRERYTHMADVLVDDETSIDIQLDRSLSGAVDRQTGWPCVHGSAGRGAGR